MPSINEYCSNPSEYVNLYPPDTIKYWNTICKDRTNSNDTVKNDISKLAGYAAKGSVADLNVLGKALVNMIMSILSPEGMKMMGIFLGIDFGVKTLYRLLLKVVKNYIAKGITSEIIDLSAKISADAAIDVASSNAAVISAELAGEMGAELAGESAAVWALELVGEAFSGIMGIFEILQLWAMIFDASDPCNYNTQLSKDAVNQFTASFNKMYRENGVVAYNSFTDVYGKTEYLNVWPIEYTGTQFLLDIHTSPEYKLAYTRYTARYLSSLRINSVGDVIYLPDGGVTIADMNNSEWQKMEKQLSNALADGNTVVANNIIRFWPLFVIIAILILIFIIYIVK